MTDEAIRSLSDPTREPAISDRGVDITEAQPDPGIGLCLSGGGYRAMLFHAGALLRLNEVGVLWQLERVSSVSGGSITAAVLGAGWGRLAWTTANGLTSATNLRDIVIAPLQRMAEQTIDVWSAIGGIANPFRTISEEVAAAYDKYLFHGSTLQDLPSDRSDPDATVKGPRFVLNATNVKTGSLWRFSKPYMADYRIGMIDWPRLPLAVAVAASSAFPPFLSPMRVNLDDFNFRAGVPQPPPSRSLRSEAVLTDGGVYDNLGLEPVWKHYQTVLISDGGRKMDDDPAPATDWAWHSRRLIDLLQHEVSNLRRRQAITSFQQKTRSGTYWGIQTDIDHYQFPGALVSHVSPATQRIAQIETRLAAMSENSQELIINWGYAVCDAAIRKHVLPNFTGPAPEWPFPKSPITADCQPT